MDYSFRTVSGPMGERPPGSANDIQGPPPKRAWIWACLFLLAVTWLPLAGIHLYRTSLSDAGTGTAVAVFSPWASTADVFHSVIQADGSLVRPVSWLRRTWIVHSLEPGFAGRLREQGAWAVYSTELLSLRALFKCFALANPSSASRSPDAAPPWQRGRCRRR